MVTATGSTGIRSTATGCATVQFL